MMPTLYAEDVNGDRFPFPLEYRAFGALLRILPRKCGCGDGRGTLNLDPPGSEIHTVCEGRGWLYPPMPDWYAEWRMGRDAVCWEDHLEATWRAMGILKVEATR